MTTDGEVLTTGGEPSTTGAEVTTTGGEAMMTEDVTFLQHLHQILVLSQTVQPVLCLRFAYDVCLDSRLDSQRGLANSPGAAASCRAWLALLAERIAAGLVKAVDLAHLTAMAVVYLELRTATQENVILRTPTMDTTALRAAHSVLLAI